MKTGEKIKRLRSERGWTQSELGERIGVQKAAINKYETGVVVNFKREIIAKLSNAFDVNPAWLIDEEEEWPPVPSIRQLVNNAVHAGMAMERNISGPKSEEAKIISAGIDKMEPERREQALKVLQAIFADIFDGGNK